MALLQVRHIQNYSDAATLEPHWGYVDRALPCTNDAGSCAYLDVVYHSHDLGILYIGIFWALVVAILLVWAVSVRCLSSSSVTDCIPAKGEDGEQLLRTAPQQHRLVGSITAAIQNKMLPDGSRRIFGRTTRLQIAILAILTTYLAIFSFVGISYNTWITPVKKNPGVYNTRTSLGPWADRIGVLAFGLTPLSIMLSSRESILSLITGVPYHHFNFLHRWLGYIIVIQGLLHTIGWTIVEAILYQPQPSVAQEWIKQAYMIWGCVAILLLLSLWFLSLSFVVRRTGYEFFRKAHYLLAMGYIGACWGHWKQLKCFLLPSLLIWFLDRAARLARTFLIHHQFLPTGQLGFRPARAQATVFADNSGSDVVRLDLQHPNQSWHVGQHFYLCFLEGSIWQSHPFTPLSLPLADRSGFLRHSYLFRAKGGETKRILEVIRAKTTAPPLAAPSTAVILSGPYGQSIVEGLNADTNVLCVAGGTGITFVLPVLLHLIRSGRYATGRQVQLVWAVRQARDTLWVKTELDELEKAGLVTVRICTTREVPRESSIESTNAVDMVGPDVISADVATVEKNEGGQTTYPTASYDQRPDLTAVVQDFIGDVVHGPSVVFTSGPGSMLSDMRQAVASCNSAGKVWKGDERCNVKIVYDDRLEG